MIQVRASGPSFNAEQIANECHFHLRQSASRVAVFRYGCKIQKETLLRPPTELAQILALAQQDLSGLSIGAVNEINRVGDSDLIPRRGQGVRPSHLPKVGDLTGGFQPGTLSLICARTNVGKSVFMGSIALDVAINQRLPVLYLDTEMGVQAMLQRAVSWRTGIDENKMFKAGGYQNDPAIRQAADEAKAIIQAAPLFHVAIGAMSHEQTAAMMRQFRRCIVDTSPTGQGLVIFDYLKAGSTGRIPEYQILGEMAAGIRGIAAELNLPVIVGIQAGRQAMQDEPRRLR